MKKIRLFAAITVLAATASFSACGVPANPAVTTTTSAVTDVLQATLPDDEDPDITEEEVPYITVPEQTTGVSAREGELSVSLGGNDEEAVEITDGNQVFIVSVEAGTTEEMMNEVIEKYDLEVVYDYESLNMYALAVPEPLDENDSAEFMKELTSEYSFILMVEPDSVVTLD